MLGDVTSHSHFLRFHAKLHFAQLFHIQASVPVSSTSDWSWDSSASSVDSLPNVVTIDPSRNLFYKNWGQAFGTQILVHTQEVDFSTFDLLVI